MTAMMMILRAMLATGPVEREDGQTMVEYGLILAGVAVVVVTTVFLLGGAIADQFQSILDSLTGAGA